MDSRGHGRAACRPPGRTALSTFTPARSSKDHFLPEFLPGSVSFVTPSPHPGFSFPLWVWGPSPHCCPPQHQTVIWARLQPLARDGDDPENRLRFTGRWHAKLLPHRQPLTVQRPRREQTRRLQAGVWLSAVRSGDKFPREMEYAGPRSPQRWRPCRPPDLN